MIYVNEFGFEHEIFGLVDGLMLRGYRNLTLYVVPRKWSSLKGLVWTRLTAWLRYREMKKV